MSIDIMNNPFWSINHQHAQSSTFHHSKQLLGKDGTYAMCQPPWLVPAASPCHFRPPKSWALDSFVAPGAPRFSRWSRESRCSPPGDATRDFSNWNLIYGILMYFMVLPNCYLSVASWAPSDQQALSFILRAGEMMWRLWLFELIDTL